MARNKQPPRLYLDPQRQKWVIRYEGYFRRTLFGPEEKAEAQMVLDKLLGNQNWVRSVRELRAKPKARTIPPWARANTVGIVYFISVADDPKYPIKIGFCSSVIEKRLSELQVGNPHRLSVLASDTATFAQEQRLHAMLVSDQLTGEWFIRSHAVLQALNAAQVRFLSGWIGEGGYHPSRAETVPNVTFVE